MRAATRLLSVLLLVASGAWAAPERERFLSEPRAGSPQEIALDFVRAHAARLGVEAADLEELLVAREYASGHTGVTHVWLTQGHGGIPVTTTELGVHVMADGRVLHFTGRAVPGLAAAVNAELPGLPAEAAIEAGAAHLGLAVAETPRLLANLGGADQAAVFDGAGVSQDPIPAALRYLPAGGQVRLTWNLAIHPFEGEHWWSLWVDAESGAVLRRDDWVSSDPIEAIRQPGRSIPLPAREAPLGCAGAGTADYLVYALPGESPSDGPRTCQSDPQTAASPFGWHDTNGAAGAEFTDTRGNNVFAQEDRDANDMGGFRPDGGADLDFSFPIDLNDPPIDYQAGAITNLFYWNSIIHDLYYAYGFDEPSGNFQENNYGNGGLGSDPVQADAQDGSGTNNANFSTPPDGNDPRMQMFEWVTPFLNRVTVNSDPIGPYGASGANFGPAPAGETGDVIYVDDGMGLDIHDGCEPFSMGGNEIALINRGNCTFVTKVRNAQTAGADAAIIRKVTPGNPITMGDDGTGGDIVIPAVMISMADGDELIAALPANVTIGPNPAPEVNRDSDLDNGVIAHEYTHGLSNRLTGTGPGCLNNNEQAGEGWSDWYALAVTPEPTDTGATPRGIGTYVSFEDPDGLGIRSFHYSTDLGVNPLTYGTIGVCDDTGSLSPHCVGERWASIAWEVYWNLVDAYGFDPDLYEGTGGNNLAIQLVTDGLKLQPCSPGFVDARDAILAADVALTGGENECFLWTAFAKRGLGLSADQGSSSIIGDETEAFDLPSPLPSPCAPLFFSDGFETGNTSEWDQTVN